MSELTRRDMLVIAGACACGAMCASQAEAQDKPKKPAGPAVKSLAIGKLSDFPKLGFYDKFAKPNKVMIARLDDRLVVLSAVCTHKGSTVRVKPGTEEPTLRCPSHGAEFSPYGTPTAGPAKTALVRYAVSAAPDGTITADLTKTFIESKWEEDGAFLKAEKPKA